MGHKFLVFEKFMTGSRDFNIENFFRILRTVGLTASQIYSCAVTLFGHRSGCDEDLWCCGKGIAHLNQISCDYNLHEISPRKSFDQRMQTVGSEMNKRDIVRNAIRAQFIFQPLSGGIFLLLSFFALFTGFKYTCLKTKWRTETFCNARGFALYSTFIEKPKRQSHGGEAKRPRRC